MSSAELLPLFPSATHPALPIAQRLLSTLRNLTAPGRGNDIRAEERAALVGVAALLGCEKVQSKDLIESAAQKACSVSPAHFRSALAKSRNLLATSQTAESSPSGRRTRPAGSSSSPLKYSDDANAAGPSRQTGLPAAYGSGSAFETPRKRQKHLPGLDLTGLVRNTPSRGSPLKNSMTPRRPGADLETPSAAGSPFIIRGDDRDATEGEADPMTPTKTGTAKGKARDIDARNGTTSSSRRPAEDYSAFLALRPGSASKGPGQDSGTAGSPTPRRRNFAEELRSVRKKSPAKRQKTVLRARRDWTYKEESWGSQAAIADGVKRVKQILEKMGAALQVDGSAPLSLSDALLQADNVIRGGTTAGSSSADRA